MENYLSLDKGERIPLEVTLHLLMCKRCRNEVRLLRKAEKAAAAKTGSQVSLDDPAILAVMSRIPAAASKKNPISFSKWIIWGVIMFAALIVSALSVKANTDHRLTIYTYIELAALITVYCSLFIKSNMDFFVKVINTKVNPTFAKKA